MPVTRYVCVHGHFYQPPRENPWLEVVEQQDSAWPFHDWNERITAECYRPNANARILDDEGRIVRLVNNYARMSFNVGPTLLTWMRDHAPDVHDAVVAADAESADRFGGHGSAMAQVHNHLIMPLADERDRRTQVRWGIADFEHRFGRRPEGMWLSETAVDVPTLEVLADEGIVFTVLSPYQAARVRAPKGQWRDVSDGSVDPTQPYWVRLPSGRRITIFFYDGPASRAVAFEGLLESGDALAERLLDGFVDRDGPQLVHIATDGESYGHHHRHGEMALAHALERLEADPNVTLTNYAQFLALHPPTMEAEVLEPSSWSCAHGVERWRADCGCTTGGEPGTSQAWRTPLRDALDWLREEVRPRYEDHARKLLTDPWAARDAYIDVVLDRTRADAFLDRHARRPLGPQERVEALELLELQRHAMLMYTSCGWFFDEISRLEPVQVLFYAARTIQVAGERFGDRSIQGEFLQRLEKAASNDPPIGDGRSLYELMVEPAIADLEKVAAHFAISGLFHRPGPRTTYGCFEVERLAERHTEAGRAKLAYGRLRIRSVITTATADFDYGVLHLGDHNFSCGVRPSDRDRDYELMAAELEEAFTKADFPETIRSLDEHFGSHLHSLRDLFRDEQRRILTTVLSATLEETEAAYRTIYRGRAPLMRFLADLGATIPVPLVNAAEVVVNAELRGGFDRGEVDAERVRELIDEATRLQLDLDVEGIAHALDRTIRRTGKRIQDALAKDRAFDRFEAEEDAPFSQIHTLVVLARSLPFEVDLSRTQHVCYRAVHEHRPALVARAEAGDESAARWVAALDGFAELLHVAVP